MANESRQNNTEWLIEKLRTAEEERDNALNKLEELQLENLSLRGRLRTIGIILGDETFTDDTNAMSNSEDIF